MKKTKRFFLTTLVIICFSLSSAQELVTDTVSCGGYYIILQVPSLSYKYATIQKYEEGFFKTYPNLDSSYVFIFKGSMVKLPFLKSNNKCSPPEIFKIGNIASSTRLTCDNKYFREDYYVNQGIVISYNNIDESDLPFFDSILNNAKIKSIKR